MDNILKSGVFFWVFLVIYLFVRDWPMGDTRQTMLDAFVVIVVVVTIVQTFFNNKNNKNN